MGSNGINCGGPGDPGGDVPGNGGGPDDPGGDVPGNGGGPGDPVGEGPGSGGDAAKGLGNSGLFGIGRDGAIWGGGAAICADGTRPGRLDGSVDVLVVVLAGVFAFSLDDAFLMRLTGMDKLLVMVSNTSSS